MKELGRWTMRVAIALAALAAPALAAAAGCGSPPDRSGDWHFVDDVAMNLRKVASGPVTTGTWDAVDREVNYESSTRDVTLSWSGTTTVSYSGTLERWAGKRDTRRRESVRVSLDLPPLKEARLRIREASRLDFYEFDAGCIWFDADTNRYRRIVADYGVRGTADHTWHQSDVSIRTAY